MIDIIEDNFFSSEKSRIFSKENFDKYSHKVTRDFLQVSKFNNHPGKFVGKKNFRILEQVMKFFFLIEKEMTGRTFESLISSELTAGLI